MNPREQEALSKRYAYRASVTPLADGSFAIFSLDFSPESMVIVDNADDLGLAITSRANMNRRRDAKGFDEVDFDQA